MNFIEKIFCNKTINELKNELYNQKHILDVFPIPIFIKNKEGIYIYCNQAYIDFLKFNSFDDVIGKTVYDIEKPELAEIYNKRDNEIFNQPEKEQKFEFILNRNNNSYTISMFKKALLNHKNEYYAFIAVLFNISEHKFIQEKLSLENKDLKNKIITDPLTGAFNRIKYDEVLSNNIDLAKRYKDTFSLAFFDIDFFKKINDNYGHQVGDEVLIKFTKVIMDNIRTTDIFCRIGGEEFALILPNTNLNKTFSTIDKIRNIISNTHFDTVSQITCSIGISEYRNGEEIRDLVKRTDDALYSAKTNGRNQTIKG